MRAIIVISIASLALLFASRADAQVDHKFYPLSIDLDSVVLIDRLSIQGQNPKFIGWVLFVYSPPVKRVQHKLSRARFDCASQTMSIIYSASYDAEGDAVGESKTEGNPTPVVPNSIGETLLHDVCTANKTYDPKLQLQSVDEAISFAKDAMDFLQKLPKKK